MGDLSNFDEFTSGTIAAQLATSGVPSGMGARAVRLGTETTESAAWQCVLVPKITFTQGFAAGRARILVNVDAQATHRCGLIIGMDQRDVTGTSGSCYVYSLDIQPAGQQRNRLYRTTTGLDNITQLAEFSETIAAGVHAIEIEWRYDANLYEGVYLRCSRGADFDSLALKIEHMDQGSHLTSYTAEAFFTAADTNGALVTTYHDSITVTGLTLDDAVMRRWEKFKPISSDAKVFIDHRATPLLGSGSLNFVLTTNTPYGAHLANTAAIPAALTAGKITLRMRVTNTGGRSFCGLLIMNSARNILGASGTAYAVCVDIQAASTRQAALIKLDAGLDSIDNTALATGDPTGLPHPSILWLEVIWQTSGGNTRLQCFVSENEDKSDRAEAFDHTDSTSAYTTTAGMNIFAHPHPTNAGGIDLEVNNVTIETFPGFE